MLVYPDINPVALDLGPVKIHWYGIMYIVAFAQAWWLGKLHARRSHIGWTEQDVGDLIFFGAIGVVVGGRLGYMLFYNFGNWISDPLSLFEVWNGGMSFHGGLIGVIATMIWFGRKTKRSFFEITDFVAPLVPLGYFAGRLGNFINGELWGRVTDVPWGMVFSHVGPEPRHPSMLYQGVLEGLVLFVILWAYAGKPRPRMAVSALFLIGMGCFRIFNEWFREPDVQIGFVIGDWLTMGQLLSVPMVVLGVYLFRRSHAIQRSGNV